VTFQDLTQFKKIEEELKQADRLAAIGRLAAGMAHEIRNPLASISGSVQLLKEADHAKPEDIHLMDIVVKEADRLNGLLTDFLSFARPKRLKKKAVDVSAILNQLIDLLKTDYRFEMIDIQCHHIEKIELMLDRDQVLQALWDLAINACEAMEGRGRLTFSVESQKGGVIFIEDSGPGISEEVKNRIFEPFFSTKDKGTGLGLASVYSVLEAHGGCVTVDVSSLGGARFALWFLTGDE
jgi:two-component system sensor histidine kinase PilS (NtrC family)